MIIKNVKLLTEDFEFINSDIKFNEKIEYIGNQLYDKEVIDASGLTLIPGLIDIHTHGTNGFDTLDGDFNAYKQMSKSYAKNGVTSFLFTTMTVSENVLISKLKVLSDYIDSNGPFAYSHGIYLEGPFISKDRKGAQDEKYIRKPDYSLLEKLNVVSGDKIKIVAIAPEEENSYDFINAAKNKYVVSIAHTNADYETAKTAIKSGCNNITHLFNAMPPLNHRNPGTVGAAFESDIYTELICDGFHIHPSVIKTVFEIKKDKVILISDSMSAAGMKDGKYSLGGQAVNVKNGIALLENGTIAGSTTNLLQCVKNCIDFGVDNILAIKAATINPASLLGIDNITGSISLGKFSDFILIDDNFNLMKVFVKGNLCFDFCQ